VPAPSHSTAEGIVWLPEQFLIRAQADGFFDRWLIASGHQVDKGTPLLVMTDPEVKAKVEATQAEFDELTARFHAVEFTDSAAASIVREQVRQVEQKLAFAQSKYARLFISAAADGELIIPNAQDMPGHFFKKGELLGYVLNRTQLVARVAVAQENIDLVRNHLRAVEVRAVERRGEASDSMVLRAYGGAVTELPSAALTSFGGGELPADPSEEGGLKTLHSVFLLDLAVPSSTGANGIGAHVYARFEHVREPIAMQLYRRIRQLLLSRLNV
jgi:putative peptide zinc metalloprotease protein